MNQKRFQFDTEDPREGAVSDLLGIIHQENFEILLNELREETKRGNKYSIVWMPIVSLYYEKDGEKHYEHFVHSGCVGMFHERASELQEGINNGVVSNVAVYRTTFRLQSRKPNTRGLKYTNLNEIIG